jgi:ribosomal protein L29
MTTAAQKELDSIRRELLDLRIRKAHGDLRDTSQFKKLKKKVARILNSITSSKPF